MILVTGATGLLGSHLLYFLLKENTIVRATQRKNSNLQTVKMVFDYYTNNANVTESLYKKIDWIEADVTNIPQLSEAFKGITQVYHCAAYINFEPKNFHKLKKSNIEGTANIVNLSIINSVKKLCYVSSIATMGSPSNGTFISEETQWNAEEDNSVYSITKYGAEMEMWRGTQEGLDAIIVNPGVIFGSGFWDSGSGIILKIGSRGIPIYTTGGIGLVDVIDVVKAMIQLMQSEIKNQRYILVGKNILYRELLTEIADQFNKKPPRKAISKWKLLFLSKIDWFFNKVFGSKRKFLKSMIASLYKVSIYDSSKIERDLDFKFTPFKETLERVVKNYKMES